MVSSLDEAFHGSQTPSLQGNLLTVAHLGFRGDLRKEYTNAKRRGDIDKKTSYSQWLDMGKGLSCYRLCPDAPPEVVWELPNKFGSGNTSPALGDRYGYFHTSIGLCAIELDTGKVHRKHGAIGTYIALKSMGERLFQYGRMWDISQPATPKEAGHIGSIGGFKTVLYADGCVADGRLYLRGWIDDDSLRAGDAPERGSIACLDLRKNIVSLPVRDVLDSTQPVAAKSEALTRLAWHEAPTVRADAVRALGKNGT